MLKTFPELLAEAATKVETVSIKEALVIENVVIIDVRELQEASQRPVAGSINIPRGILEFQVTQYTQDPSAPICVHCASGARATLAAEQLIRLGFTNVRAISSGIDDISDAVGS